MDRLIVNWVIQLFVCSSDRSFAFLVCSVVLPFAQFSLRFMIINMLLTSNNQRLGGAFDDLDPRLSLLCQVGDDVIRPCKICGGCQKRVPRSINSFHDRLIVSYNFDSSLYLGVRSFYVERNN